MKISHKMVQAQCRRRGITLSELLKSAGVSRNAYYSLAKKKSVVPKSLIQLAECLNTPVSDLLHDEAKVLREHSLLLNEANELIKLHPELEQEGTRHTLLLLKEEPIDRLRRALVRGRIGLA